MSMQKIKSDQAIKDLLEIAEDLAKIEHLQAFMDNIHHLTPDKGWTLFEWWECYLAWSELSTEPDMEIFYGE